MARVPLLTKPEELREFCSHLQQVPQIGWDTEFIPENTFEPLLCLIQVSTAHQRALIDPLALPDLSLFWDALLRPDVELIVHAGKEEYNFCLNQAGRLPTQVFDVQVAAGLTGFGYPLSYDNLTQKLLQVSSNKKATRTDWRQRPLSEEQLQYASDDVKYLLPLRQRLGKALARKDRTDWLEAEMQSILARHWESRQTERWHRISGAGSLTPQQLPILKHLAKWREDQGRRLDKPVRWILRDDLLIELVRRQPRSVGQLQAVRGIGQVIQSGWGAALIQAIERGLDEPEIYLPRSKRRYESPDEQMVFKILSAAVLEVARQTDVASSLLGTNEDLRDYLDWYLGRWEPDADWAPATGATDSTMSHSHTQPRLTVGWRAEICDTFLTKLLRGDTSVRLQWHGLNPSLRFEPWLTSDSDEPNALVT